MKNPILPAIHIIGIWTLLYGLYLIHPGVMYITIGTLLIGLVKYLNDNQ